MHGAPLTHQSGVFKELVAGLKGHLLQRGRVGPDGEAVEGFVDALEAHVVGHQRQVPGVHLDAWRTQDVYIQGG